MQQIEDGVSGNPSFKRNRYREQFWQRGTMQARKFHFALRAWEWSRFWIMNDRGRYRGQF